MRIFFFTHYFIPYFINKYLYDIIKNYTEICLLLLVINVIIMYINKKQYQYHFAPAVKLIKRFTKRWARIYWKYSYTYWAIYTQYELIFALLKQASFCCTSSADCIVLVLIVKDSSPTWSTICQIAWTRAKLSETVRELNVIRQTFRVVKFETIIKSFL